LAARPTQGTVQIVLSPNPAPSPVDAIKASAFIIELPR
jgi:hypothetical protein